MVFKIRANPGIFSFIFVLILFQLPFRLYKLKKSIDGVLGIQTQGRRMVGADETTELWRPQHSLNRLPRADQSCCRHYEVS